MNTSNTKSLPLIESDSEKKSQDIGCLSVTIAEKPVALPLKEVSIQASVADRIAQVSMRQTFQNAYTEPLEAVYIFPLSGSAAVSHFELKVGSRIVKGIVKEREEARRDYEAALDQGKRAGLLEQERDDVFTVQVGNLPPGEEVTVLLTYSERLPFYASGTTELRLPLVVAPRYIPGAPLERSDVGDGVENDSDIVADASRITPPRLCPGFDPKVSLHINVDLFDVAKKGIADLCCSQHAVRTQTQNDLFQISLSSEHELLNRDFVLRWRIADETIQSTLLVSRDEDGNTSGLLSIIPPDQSASKIPRDVVFILDRSGSMEGIKMVSAARACMNLLSSLNPVDRFCILAFDNQVEWFPSGKVFLPADEAGREKGEKYLHNIQARGGTEMFDAFTNALLTIQERKDTEKRLPVFVLITDGQVGDESRILQRMQTELANTRVFTVGVDTAVNQTFLKRLASLGGGTASFVEPGVQMEEALQQVARDIGTPLIVDLNLEDVDTGLHSDSITPERLPDLFVGRPVVAFFRVQKAGKIRLRGHFADGRTFEDLLDARSVSMPAFTHLWARSRVMDLEDKFRIDRLHQTEIKQQIVHLAIKHSLLTRFTAFVVIDETEIVNADGTRRKIVQPVSMPEHWEMDFAAPSPARSATISGAYMCMDASPAAPMWKASSARIRPMEMLEAATEKVTSYMEERKKKKDDRKNVRNFLRLLDEFSELLDRITSQIGSGKIVQAKELEEARTRLIQALMTANLDFVLPDLLEFLRRPAAELVKVFRDPTSSQQALKPLFEKQSKAFQEIRKKAQERMSKKDRTSTPRFWESSI